MSLIAGVDIGNSTTEVALADQTGKNIAFLSSSSHATTGTKGTVDNVPGIRAALEEALRKAGRSLEELDMIRLNEAAPVIGDTAMETITETIITDSAMIGHNPSTPAGVGYAVGYTLHLENFSKRKPEQKYILVAGKEYSYEKVAEILNALSGQDKSVTGLILQADEAVLVWNRLQQKIPIIDEVKRIDKIPEGKMAAIEVAMPGQVIRQLSNPYGIATLLGLDSEETRLVTPIAKSLIGKKSAVVIRTGSGYIGENILPAGDLYIDTEELTKADGSLSGYEIRETEKRRIAVSVDAGAVQIMETVRNAGNIADVSGQDGTNAGTMFHRMKTNMSRLTQEEISSVHITDLLAVDTLAPVLISGALAGETCMEKAVGIAAMVRTKQLPMQRIADKLAEELHTSVKVAGIEAAMALIGAFTTPGTRLPLAIVDMGGGSTDAAMIDERQEVRYVHKAGAGEMVTMLIRTELGLHDRSEAEMIKRYPLAKVESLFHMRLEDGSMRFLPEAIDPRYYGCVVMLLPDQIVRLEEDIPMERIMDVRREAKKKVFIENVLRALQNIAPEGDMKKIPNVVLVGGSAEDFEIPEMLTEVLSKYRIVCGRGNIRATEGPRNAVATGLVLSGLENQKDDAGEKT